MDPQATLREILTSGCFQHACDLLEWLLRGGFAPTCTRRDLTAIRSIGDFQNTVARQNAYYRLADELDTRQPGHAAPLEVL